MDISKVSAICSLLSALLAEPGERFADKAAVKLYMAHCFVFAYIWCVGGNVVESHRQIIEDKVKRQFEEFEEAE